MTPARNHASEPEVDTNGKIVVNGWYSFWVWVLTPFVKAGPGLLLATAILVFIAYEIDKLGSPLLDKYGAYVDGQTEFTKTVKDGMETQTKATGEIQVLALALKGIAEATAADTKCLKDKGTVPAQHVEQMMEQALEMMKGVPAERKKQTEVLQAILDALKNESAGNQPRAGPIPNCDGAVSKS